MRNPLIAMFVWLLVFTGIGVSVNPYPAWAKRFITSGSPSSDREDDGIGKRYIPGTDSVNKQDIAVLEDHMEKIQERVDRLEKRSEALEQDADNFEDQIRPLNDQIRSLSERIDQLSQKLDPLIEKSREETEEDLDEDLEDEPASSENS